MDALKKKKSKPKLLESSYCEIFAHTEIVTNPTLMWGMKHCTHTPWQPVCIFSESPHHSPFLWALTLQIRVLFASHMWFYHIQVSVKEVWYYLWHNFIYRRWFIMETNRTNTFTSQEWALTPPTCHRGSLSHQLFILSHLTWCEEHQHILLPESHSLVHSLAYV